MNWKSDLRFQDTFTLFTSSITLVPSFAGKCFGSWIWTIGKSEKTLLVLTKKANSFKDGYHKSLNKYIIDNAWFNICHSDEFCVLTKNIKFNISSIYLPLIDLIDTILIQHFS